MANDDHIALLKKGVDAWNAWRDEYRKIRPDLSEEDLSGADLSRADLLEGDTRTRGNDQDGRCENLLDGT
jgi:hypothetical protein